MILGLNLQPTPLERDSGSAEWPIPFWHLCLHLPHRPRSDGAVPPPALDLYRSANKITHKTVCTPVNKQLCMMECFNT